MAATLTKIVKRFFHDKRLTVVVLIWWMSTACVIFSFLGAFHSQFMTFGPSETTQFMAMKIDTWGKWYALAMFSFMNTTINEFIGSALVPWFTNTIQDQKTKYLDHERSTCIAISLIFDVYTHVMSIFGMYLMFSQIDFLLIRMIADCIVTVFTTIEWMKNKKVDKRKHDMEGGLIRQSDNIIDSRHGGVDDDEEVVALSFANSVEKIDDDDVDGASPVPATTGGDKTFASPKIATQCKAVVVVYDTTTTTHTVAPPKVSGGSAPPSSSSSTATTTTPFDQCHHNQFTGRDCNDCRDQESCDQKQPLLLFRSSLAAAAADPVAIGKPPGPTSVGRPYQQQNRASSSSAPPTASIVYDIEGNERPDTGF